MKEKLHKFDERGFTLLELLVVVAILVVVSAVSIIGFVQALPIVRFQNTVQEVAANLNLARQKAIMDGNQWFVQFYYENVPERKEVVNTYVIIDDDGWKRVGERIWFFDVNNANFNSNYAENGVIDQWEIYKGPVRLKPSVRFLKSGDYPSVNKIRFRSTGSCLVPKGTNSLDIWIADQFFKPGDNSRDNLLHQRRINVDPRTGKVEIFKDLDAGGG